MAIYGTGIIASIVMKQEDPDWYPAYRWDKPGTPYYHLRPDRLFAQFRGGADISLLPILVSRELRGVGGPSVSPQPPPIASKRVPESRKGRKTNSAHGFSKPKAVSARGKCPKGHYWSYKKKKCVKSKF